MKKWIIYLMLTCASVFWGVSFILTKEISICENGQITPLQLITFRMVLASAVMMPLLAITKRLERIQKADLKWFLLLSFTEPFLYSFLETSGTMMVDGSLAAVIVATIPLFVPFGMAAAYRERIHWATLLGIALSLAGISLMLLGGSNGFSGKWEGLLFLVGAVVVAVIYTLILVKVVDRYRPITITVWQNFFGMLYYIPFMLLIDGKGLALLSFSPKMILMVLALGVLCSTVAYMFYNYGIRSIGATAACIFTNTIPVFSMLAAVAIGQEHFSPWKAGGMLIVITGVIIAQMAANKNKKT